MAYFAELDNNNTVLRVISISNSVSPDNTPTSEHDGLDFIADVLGLGGVWKQTSFNTQYEYAPVYDEGDATKVVEWVATGRSIHSNGGTPFRGKYAAIGDTYDAVNDVFVAPTVEE